VYNKYTGEENEREMDETRYILEESAKDFLVGKLLQLRQLLTDNGAVEIVAECIEQIEHCEPVRLTTEEELARGFRDAFVPGSMTTN